MPTDIYLYEVVYVKTNSEKLHVEALEGELQGITLGKQDQMFHL